MNILLRSCFVSAPTDNRDLHLRNYHALLSSGLGFQVPEDTAIWTFIEDFVQTHQHVPDYNTIRNFFEHSREDTVVDRIEALALQAPIVRGDFVRRVEDKAHDRRVRRVTELLKEAGTIVQTGIKVKEGKDEVLIRGPVAALRYLMDHGHDIVTPTMGSKLSGDVTKDGVDFEAEYDRVKNDPLAGVGQYTGIKQIDYAIRGAKRKELWTHAAFTGGLKSTFALNWIYNQSVYYKHDSLFFSLEMPYEQCRRLLYALHSCHEKFKGIHPPLDYLKVRDGELSPDGEAFLKKHVIPDFNDPANNYGSIHIEVADPMKTDFKVADLRARAELIYARSPFSMIVVDHALLVSPRRWVPSTTERLNEVIRDCKKLAMSFNKGLGMAVVLLFQISREGFKAAEKGGGRYNLTHLSYANEAERSSDVVTASYLNDELARNNKVQFQCLKSRDQRPFELFQAEVFWPTRRIRTLEDSDVEDVRLAGEEIDLAAEVS